ncbi:MAG: extracellular solute-binding protein [Alphaproteobacteria bacterium]|nr:extracellular solute-binding protein [Alphaproteobacteria bacterium]
MLDQTRRQLLLGGGASLGVLVGGARLQAQQSASLTIYNGQHRQTTESLVAAFTKATGIQVTVRQGESAQLANQIIEEGARSPADILYSEISPPMVALDEKGLLAPLEPSIFKDISADYVSPNKTWIGTSLRCRVIIYNKAMIKPQDLPHSILDVAQASWKDRFGYAIRDGFPEQIMAIVKLKGRDAALAWLKGLKQYGRLYNGNGAAMNAVEAGEVPIALNNNYYWFGLAKERGEANMKSALHYVDRGDAGALINLSPAAILKSSKQNELAQKFLAFMVSEAGQKAIITPYAEYPVRAGLTPPFNLKPIADIGSVIAASDIGNAQLAYELMREASLL